MAKKATCHVEFRDSRLGVSAILFDRRGRSLNVVNFPRGHAPSTKERTRARRLLMTGCTQLTRRRG